MGARVTAVLFDVDGTLVNSNDAHAAAWIEAFEAFGVRVDPIALRRSIGMGGDKLMPAVSSIDESSPLARKITARRGEIFRTRFLPTLTPFPGARGLISAITSRELTAVAASSAAKEELEPLLEVAGAKSLMDAWTSGDDAEASKPEPDIIHVALQRAKADAREAVMIGDTPYDVAAARQAGVRAIAFRCGGWLDPDLVGAVEIYDGPWDLLAQLDRSILLS